MPGEEIRLGPFVGGLNTFSDPTAIDDVELAICENFDMYPDGTLVNRPPINDLNIAMPLPALGSMVVLGWFVSPSGAPALIGTDNVNSTYYFDGNTWVLITNTIAAAAIAQYRDKLWLVAAPTSPNPGGSWELGGVFTAVPTMPKGRTIAVSKERLWVGPGKNVTSNGSRVYFCAIADPNTWNGDFITINTGDGQNVLEITVYFQDLLIFKNNSTYRFSYDIDPAMGTISRVSDTVGIFDTGCVTTFENRIFVLHNNSLYELSNYNYDRLNDRVPFRANNTSTALTAIASLSYFSNRVFVSFFDVLYVWSVKTRSWSTWNSVALSNIGEIFPIPGEQENTPTAYTSSRSLYSDALFDIVDAITANSEAMSCTLRTKNFDYETASRFKRLFSWGLDCIARSTVEGTVIPVEFATTVTWGQLKAFTWGDVKQSPWGRLLGSTSERVDTVAISGLTGERKYIKLGDRSLRFRQVGFKVKIDTDGTSATAPVVVFNLLTSVKDKQSVVKRIS